jgi:hypothetical protein
MIEKEIWTQKPLYHPYIVSLALGLRLTFTLLIGYGEATAKLRRDYRSFAGGAESA